MADNLRKRSEQPEFIRKQFEFAAHIRDPERNPCPDDVEGRRMAVYRELFFNNVEDFMASSYPVLHDILGEKRWHEMMKDYFARHRAETPLFPGMPAEFLVYLQGDRQPLADDPPFMLALAHYEWMELVAAQADEPINWKEIDVKGDLLSGRPFVSPLAWVLTYPFPVHRICPEFQPVEPSAQPTAIIVHRNKQDEVGFIEINSMTSILLQRLQENPDLTGSAALGTIAGEMRLSDIDLVISGGLEIMEGLREHDIILGTRMG